MQKACPILKPDQIRGVICEVWQRSKRWCRKWRIPRRTCRARVRTTSPFPSRPHCRCLRYRRCPRSRRKRTCTTERARKVITDDSSCFCSSPNFQTRNWQFGNDACFIEIFEGINNVATPCRKLCALGLFPSYVFDQRFCNWKWCDG